MSDSVWHSSELQKLEAPRLWKWVQFLLVFTTAQYTSKLYYVNKSFVTLGDLSSVRKISSLLSKCVDLEYNISTIILSFLWFPFAHSFPPLVSWSISYVFLALQGLSGNRAVPYILPPQQLPLPKNNLFILSHDSFVIYYHIIK